MSKSIKCDIFQLNAISVEYSTDPVESTSEIWQLISSPHFTHIHHEESPHSVNSEWTRRSGLSNFIRQKMRLLNQISRTYSFESTKISISFGAYKMRRLNRILAFSLWTQVNPTVACVAGARKGKGEGKIGRCHTG